jgi:hypothetical protein
MARVTICFDATDEVAAAAYRAWLAVSRPDLTSVSDDEGCGCCVHVFEVVGTPEAMAAIPASIRSESSQAGRLREAARTLGFANERADILEAAARAFRAHDHAQVVRLLEPIEGKLRATERAKLAYARKKTPLRTFWRRLVGRKPNRYRPMARPPHDDNDPAFWDAEWRKDIARLRPDKWSPDIRPIDSHKQVQSIPMLWERGMRSVLFVGNG